MIIWMPEKMNQTASNKLLKMIEEPPPMTIFLLVAENTGDILPTILSRTQLIRVPTNQGGRLAGGTERNVRRWMMKLANAVHLAEGNYSNAVENPE